MTPNVNLKDRIYCITFDRSRGNEASHRDCVTYLGQFITMHGHRDQWLVEDVDSTNRALWAAAVDKWGLPVWSTEGLESKPSG